MQKENRSKRTPAQQKKIDRMLSNKKKEKQLSKQRRAAHDAKYHVSFDDTDAPKTYSVKTVLSLQRRWRSNRFDSCLAEAKALIAKYDIKGRYARPGVPALMRCSKYGGNKWSCSVYQGWLVRNGLCRSAIVQELVFNFLSSISHEPVMSSWREEYDGNIPPCMPDEYNRELHNLATFNLESAERISKRRQAAILIQLAFKKKRRRDHRENILNGDHFGIRLNLHNDSLLKAKAGEEWFKLPQEGVEYTFSEMVKETGVFFNRKYFVFERSAHFDEDLYKECDWRLSWDLDHIMCRIHVCGKDSTILIPCNEFSIYNIDEDQFYERNPDLYYRSRPMDSLSDTGSMDSLSDTDSMPSLCEHYTEAEERAVECICKRWRLYQIKRMRPFYLVPTMHTDSKPYLFRPKLDEPWKQKPSFRMVYFLINNEVITKDCDNTGGCVGPTKMDWKTHEMKSLCWDCNPKGEVSLRKWIYGEDYTVRITKNVEHFNQYKSP